MTAPRFTDQVWEPISSAPKDGRNILVSVTHNLGDGEWETIQWVDWAKEPYVWPIYCGRVDIPFPPTHWMPLPDSPESLPSSNKGRAL